MTNDCIIISPSWYILYVDRYNCNRYDEEEAKAARDAQERSRASLQRYLFYCNRYMNHMQSLKFEHKLYASVKEKMEEMQQHNMSWIEVDNLVKLQAYIHFTVYVCYDYCAFFSEVSNFFCVNKQTLHIDYIFKRQSSSGPILYYLHLH